MGEGRCDSHLQQPTGPVEPGGAAGPGAVSRLLSVSVRVGSEDEDVEGWCWCCC